MSDFIHLHNHSDYSLLDGAQSVQTMVNTMADLKMDAVGITEHGNLFSMLPFYKAARKAGIKPIMGCEMYVSKGDHTIKTSSRESGWGYNHLVLLAMDDTGLKNLMKLVSIGYLDGFYYRPRVDKDLLRKYSAGLLCTSACLKGEIQEQAYSGSYDGARKAALELAEIFPDRFYLELQRHQIPEEDLAVEMNIKLAQELRLPLVATNDCHYALQEHWEAHDVMFCLGTGKDRDDPHRQRYATPEFYFKSADEMFALFKDVPQALENTVAIAERCNADLKLGELNMPAFPIPASAGAIHPDAYLRQLSEAGLQYRGLAGPEVTLRLDTELQVIGKMGYAGYFLIVMDFIRYARERDIPVGPGRGSAAGSLVAYALRITDVDPLEYNLLFERFLNIDRVSMPDIDIDFCQERRGEVIDYVKELYGENAVCQIITFGKLKAKSVVRDVARVLGMTYGEADRIAKLIPDSLGMTLNKALDESSDLAQAENLDDRHKDLFRFCRVLEGMNRHASTHAAGVVIAPGDLTDYIPLFKNPKTGDITTQVDMNGLEDMGLLKMDFLGLRTLTVIDKTLKMIRAKGVEIDAESIPLDDPPTYALFARGGTIGVFQFESSGMREFLVKLQPTTLADLIAMNALYRPGPMAYIDDFIERKHGQRDIVYLHPVLEPILKETNGIIVYQEQVMQIANAIAGFSLAQADIMRRAMGKKKHDMMALLEAEFVAGAEQNNIPRTTAKEIYALVARFAQYGFNKSHSTAYALVAYQTAWLKTHYPAEFMAASMTSEMGNTDRVTVLMAEARSMGLEVLPPDVNHSGASFLVDPDGRIRFGLNAIKHVGLKAADHIREMQLEHGPWDTLAGFIGDLDAHTVNRKALESLIQSGAADSFHGSRRQRMEGLDDAMKYAGRLKSESNPDQASLFGGAVEVELAAAPVLPDVPDWSLTEKLQAEKELTGHYLSGHPLGAFEEDINEFANYDFTDPGKGLALDQVRAGGLVGTLKHHQTRKGLPMAFFTLNGVMGNAEVVVFSDLYPKIRELLVGEAKVFVMGKPSSGGFSASGDKTENDHNGREAAIELKIIAEEIIPLQEVRQRLAKQVTVRLQIDKLDEELVQQLYDLANVNRGSSELRFHIVDGPLNGDEQPRVRRIRATALKVAPSATFLSELRQLVGANNVLAGR